MQQMLRDLKCLVEGNWGNIMSVLSIMLAAAAMMQAHRYNEDSKKLNNDTSKLMHDYKQRQERMYALLRDEKHSGKIILMKDELSIRKTAEFDVKNVKHISKDIKELIRLVKPMYLKRVEEFLRKKDEDEVIIRMRRELSENDVKQFHLIESKLNNYGIELKLCL